jgi:hypothetical protein
MGSERLLSVLLDRLCGSDGSDKLPDEGLRWVV